MRSISSLFLIFAICASALSPAVGQKGRSTERPSKRPEPGRPDKPKGGPSKKSTKFANVESYSEGSGAYIRWKMSYERENVGFYVYRMGRFGGQIVSEIIPGAAVRYDSEAVSDQVYTFFDPAGTIGAAYFVEAIGLNEDTLTSNSVSTNYTYDVESVDEGKSLKNADLRLTAESTKLDKDLMVDAELKSEIAASAVTPDIDKHRWVVAQPGVRIGVSNGGIIRVNKSDLQAAGFDVNSDPANWQLYMEGVERPVILGPNADYIEFFGKALDTTESDVRMYYLIAGAGPGRRMASAVLRPGLTTFASNKYNQSFFLKERTLYFDDYLNGDAENFFGRLFGPAAATSVPVNISGVDRTAGTRTITVRLRGFSLTAHNVSIWLNNTLLGNITGFNQQALTKTFTFPVELLNEGANAVQMKTASGFCLFDSLTIDFPRNYVAEGNKLDFYNDNYRKASVSGFSTPDIRLFDVTSEADPKLMSNVEIAQTNGTWGPVIPAGRGRVFSAIASSVFSGPTSVTPNIPEVLRDPTQGAQLVIISHKTFLPQAQTWADYRIGQGTSVKVVQVDDIYDEFNYGVLSSASIRSFLGYAKNNWSIPPSYVLLIGDSSIDSRNYQNYGYWNMVPTDMIDTIYGETASDDALTDFNNDGLAEIPVGRISARNSAEVTIAYDKMVQWEGSLTATPFNRGVLFAHDWPDRYDFQAMSTRILDGLKSTAGGTFPEVRVQSNEAGGTTTVLNAFNEAGPTAAEAGVFVANYTGHGNGGAWRGDSFFSKVHVPQLTNNGRPTLVTALSCLNGYFVLPDATDSLAESLHKWSNGGAVAVWASTGETTPDVQEPMAKRFYTKLGEGSLTRLGDLISDAKTQLVAGADVKRTWALFGDPMLRVRLP